MAAASVPSALANAAIVRVTLSTVQNGSAWLATALRGDKRLPPNNTDSHIKGAITVLSSSAAFEIGGVKVDASTATFPDGSTGIVLGTDVEVAGALNASGTLVATKVELDDKLSAGNKRPLELHGPLDLHGALGALDTSAKTFALRTVTVSYGGSVTYKNGSALACRPAVTEGVLQKDRMRHYPVSER